MKKLITFLVFALIVLSGFMTKAQTYSLEDCLQFALANNENLKNSQLDLAISEYQIKEVKSALLPTIGLTGQSLYYSDVPAQYAPASAFGGPDGAYQKLKLGMEQNTSASLQGSQQLYNHAVTVGLKAAKTVKEASVLQIEVTRENLIYNVTATYYTIQVLEDNLNRLSENISNLEKTSAINANLRENEIISENIHNRMQINLENLKNQYENQKLLLDKNIFTLKHLMNLEMSTPLVVDPFDYNALLTEPSMAEISQRADIRLQQANLKLSQLEKRSIAAERYPVLINSFSFGYNGYNDSFSPFKTINDDWIRTSYSAWTIKIPVFDGFQRQSKLRQKEVAIQKNINTLSMMKNNAQREMQEAASNYAANKNLLVNNQKSLELAERLFDTAQREYETGISSLTDLLNAQNDLTSARTNYSNALLNVKLAELALKKANGTLSI